MKRWFVVSKFIRHRWQKLGPARPFFYRVSQVFNLYSDSSQVNNLTLSGMRRVQNRFFHPVILICQSILEIAK
jgi:hypothetical protein